MQVQELQLLIADLHCDVVGVLVSWYLFRILDPILVDIAVDQQVAVGKQKVALQDVAHLIRSAHNNVILKFLADTPPFHLEVFLLFLASKFVHRL